MALLEYRIDPPPTGSHAFRYQTDLWREPGQRFAIFRVDGQQVYPVLHVDGKPVYARPYWLTRDQVVGLYAMLGRVLAEWPLHEPHPEDSLQSPPPKTAAREAPDVPAR